MRMCCWVQDVPTLIPAIAQTVSIARNPETMQPGENPVVCEIPLAKLLEILGPERTSKKLLPLKSGDLGYFLVPDKLTDAELTKVLAFASAPPAPAQSTF